MTTGPEIKSFVIGLFHKEMIQLASESIERYHGEKRDISSMTVSLNSKAMPELKELISSFRNNVRTLGSTSGPANQVIQVNVQAFPLTKEIK